MAKRPKRKHKEHTRKPLSDERKQELFAQVLAWGQEGRQQIVKEAEPDDLAEMAEDDADDGKFRCPEHLGFWCKCTEVLRGPQVESEGRIKRAIRRLRRFVVGA